MATHAGAVLRQGSKEGFRPWGSAPAAPPALGRAGTQCAGLAGGPPPASSCARRPPAAGPVDAHTAGLCASQAVASRPRACGQVGGGYSLTGSYGGSPPPWEHGLGARLVSPGRWGLLSGKRVSTVGVRPCPTRRCAGCKPAALGPVPCACRWGPRLCCGGKVPSSGPGAMGGGQCPHQQDIPGPAAFSL